jgi:hypothetical protein
MPDRQKLVHDWNLVGSFSSVTKPVLLNDETLRDGLRSPTVCDPSIEAKIQLLLEDLGIDMLDRSAGPGRVRKVTCSRSPKRYHKLKIRRIAPPYDNCRHQSDRGLGKDRVPAATFLVRA